MLHQIVLFAIHEILRDKITIWTKQHDVVFSNHYVCLQQLLIAKVSWPLPGFEGLSLIKLLEINLFKLSQEFERCENSHEVYEKVVKCV